MDAADASRLAHRVISGDRAAALDTMAREELGIDPAQLGGSAWTAAVTSFVLFGLGAAIPLIPFIVAAQASAIALSAAPLGSRPVRARGGDHAHDRAPSGVVRAFGSWSSAWRPPP